MITMTSKEIKNNYGAFVEAARREPVIHTNHGRQTLVTLSIDDAQNIPELRKFIITKPEITAEERNKKFQRFLELGGIGAKANGTPTDDELRQRSAEFRGNV